MNTSFQRTTASDEWYTPREIVAALGEFDLGPCAPASTHYTAKKCYTKADNGLNQDWGGACMAQSPVSPAVDMPIRKKDGRPQQWDSIAFRPHGLCAVA